jgi:transcription antitermination factor NusG
LLSVTQMGGAVSGITQGIVQQNSFPAIEAIAATEMAWYAVRTRPRHEKRVHLELQEKAIKSFLPVYAENHIWSDRQQTVHVPLFPGYVFARIANELEHRVRVLRTQGVMSFVGFRGMGVVIPDEQIHAIQSIVSARILFGPYAFLNVGQRVRIVGGSLDGIRGIISEKKGESSLVISIELIQRSVAIRVEGLRVEPI